MISQRQIISGSAGLIFAFFSSMIDLDLFFDISRDVAMATDFAKKMANSPFSSLWHSETEWDIATSMRALTAQMMPVGLYRVKTS